MSGTKKRRDLCRRFANAVRSSEKCAHCGVSGLYETLQFHHLDKTTKVRMHRSRSRMNGKGQRGGVSDVISKFGTMKKTIEEIEKCVAVCDACHKAIEDGRVWLDPNIRPIGLNRDWVQAIIPRLKQQLEEEAAWQGRLRE